MRDKWLCGGLARVGCAQGVCEHLIDGQQQVFASDERVGVYVCEEPGREERVSEHADVLLSDRRRVRW